MVLMAVAVYGLSLLNYEVLHADEATHGWTRGDRDSADASVGLPLDTNDHFMASGNCDGCHGFDETGHASVDEQGNDISPVTTWRASMMANSGRDPFFRAKMSHESLVNPQHQQGLEDKCTSCHAPLGRYSYHAYGTGPYGLADLEHDAMGQDGVSCMGCHKQTDERLGSNHSGELHYHEDMVEYGPFGKPLQGPMQGFVGVTPEYGEHVTKAGFCAGCHTLVTQSVDLQGNYTGTSFVEQATYHEWLNSDYNQQVGGITCQGCHIPRTDYPVVISANYLLLQPRTPFGKHELVGGNTFMLKLMKQHRQQLDIRANDVHFDSTIAQTMRNLQLHSLSSELTHDGFSNDTAYFSLSLRNMTGHKFPSGYPSRRAYVEFVVTDQQGDTVFSSGVLNAEHYLPQENTSYELHYDVIRSEDEVQIYEMVMGDVNGDVTTVLERAVVPLKDNRLVPRGFSTQHSTYDTTAIFGTALQDPDFNFDGFEGSGSDVVHFHVPLNGVMDTLTVRSKVYYQAVPKKWTEEMFGVQTPQIDTFRTMFDGADHTPVLVASDSLIGLVPLSIRQEMKLDEMSVYPNPSSDVIRLKGVKSGDVRMIEVFDTNGKRVYSNAGYDVSGIVLDTRPGIYLLRVKTDEGERVFRVVKR